MDMNFITAPIGTATPVSSPEGAASFSPAGQSTGSSGARKSFSSVLRTTRQEAGREQAPRSGETQSQNEPNSETRTERVRSTDGHTSQTHKSEAESSETASGRHHGSRIEESAGAPGTDRTSSTIETDAHSVPQEALLALIQTATPGPTTAEPAAPKLQESQETFHMMPDHDQAPDEDRLFISESLPATEDAEGTAPMSKEASVFSRKPETSGPPSTSQPVAEEGAESPLLRNSVSDRRSTAPIDRSTPGPMNDSDPLTPDDSRPQPSTEQTGLLDAPAHQWEHQQIGLNTFASRLANNSGQSPHETQVWTSAPPQPETQIHSLSDYGESDPAASPASPYSQYSFSESEQESGMPWPHQDEQGREQIDVPRQRDADVPRTINPTGSAGTVNVGPGTSAPTATNLQEAPASPPASQAQSVRLAPEAPDVPMPSHARSVVFELAQPDIGRINVRIALTQDLVHARLLSDRPEVGQFLINGQDRLQSALQASGLDLGQFRVDVSRQGTDHSFQHDPRQGQGHPLYREPRQQQTGGFDDTHDRPLPRHHGMLSLMA